MSEPLATSRFLMLVRACRVSASMPPGTRLPVLSTPSCPARYRTLPTRTAGEKGRLAAAPLGAIHCTAGLFCAASDDARVTVSSGATNRARIEASGIGSKGTSSSVRRLLSNAGPQDRLDHGFWLRGSSLGLT